MSDIQAANNTSNDEIDLVELVKTLWQGKVTIAVCTIVFTVCAVIYALTAQQWWTSKAIVTVGKYQDTSSYRDRVTNLYAVIGSNNSIDRIFKNEVLLKDFITDFNSYDNKRDFINQSSIMNGYKDDVNINSEKEHAVFIDKWALRIHANLVDKKIPNVYSLEFQANTPNVAHDLLTSYTKFIATKISREVIDELNATIHHTKQILVAQKLSLDSKAKKALENEIVKTNYELVIANSADVKKPLSDMRGNNLFQIDLGAQGLKEKINILNKTKDYFLFEPALSQVETKLDLINKIDLSNLATLPVVRYLKDVNYPIYRDQPKRTLIVLLALMVGVVLGCVVVLAKTMINWEKK
ncbi:chain-length determining protein [Photobacterium leiognathi subsp. mandapamensis]|uniref:LPS O-antigen chain length determinant protein WzzB n=1 Tax=Photobacterium leiognathi TaxID=553611 RepID=UPI000D162C79|nr:Wzz/FepE/Etk N-terminal domain-containing protein [Photobacterium leiognathi]PSU96071.1 chain-length determining protein [Photobacterium leiognathi subsp. mandapamensis]